MGKALLIIDMPECCAECRFGSIEDDGEISCAAALGTAADSCPLKALPESLGEDDKNGLIGAGYILGWNGCLDAIAGGKT